jgi:uncharacterized membrane protein YbhN (UPF0104 family)
MIGGAMAAVAATPDALAAVSPLALVAAVAFHLGKLSAEARAWHWIVRHAQAERDVDFATTYGAFVGAIGANAVLPARVGEALRLGVVRRRVPGSSVVTIVATIILESALEVAFGILVVVGVMLGGASLGHSGAPVRGLQGFLADPLVLAAAGGVAAVAVALALRYRRRAQEVLRRMASGFSILRSPRAFAAGVIGWKVVAWGLRIASVYAFLLAFHIPATLWTALVVLAAQVVAGALPLLPGNAGTQQAALIVALSGTASAGAVLGFGVGMQATTAIVDVVVGALALALVAKPVDLRGALAVLRRRGPQPAEA